MEYEFVYLRFHDKENLENAKSFLGDNLVDEIGYFYNGKYYVHHLQFQNNRDETIHRAFLNDFIVKENNKFVIYDPDDFYEKFMVIGGTCKIEG